MTFLAYDHVLGAVHRNRTPPLWGPYDETVPFTNHWCCSDTWLR